MDPITEMSGLIKELRKVIDDLQTKSSRYDLLVADNKSLREEVRQNIVLKEFWKSEYMRLK